MSLLLLRFILVILQKKDYLSVKLDQKKETPSSVIKLVIIINIGEFIY